VDDEALRQVLRRHLALLGREDLAGDVDEKVLTEDGVHGIIDLMLSKAFELPRAREHLVVELKRPAVKVGVDEITQIEKYAFAVAADERFSGTGVRWEFWVISNDMTDYAWQRSHQDHLPEGMIHRGQDFTIWVRKWGQVFEDCRRRLQFVQDNLNYRSTRDAAIAYLRRTHARYLPSSMEESAQQMYGYPGCVGFRAAPLGRYDDGWSSDGSGTSARTNALVDPRDGSCGSAPV